MRREDGLRVAEETTALSHEAVAARVAGRRLDEDELVRIDVTDRPVRRLVERLQGIALGRGVVRLVAERPERFPEAASFDRRLVQELCMRSA